MTEAQPMPIARSAFSSGARRPATYQDILDAPAHKVAEILDGVLYTHPRPAPRHALAGSRLGGELSGPFDHGRGGPGGWWILDEPELHLGDDVVVPDLAGWRRERLPDFPDAAYFTLAPDWVCEILSPSTHRLDRTLKRALYAREGVAHLWFIDPDPEARTLEAFALREGEWVLIASLGGDAAVAVPPFDAVSFSLADLWPDSPEPQAEEATRTQETPTPEDTPAPQDE